MLYNFTLIFLMVIQINCKLMIFLLFSGQTPDSITESLSKTLYPMINSKVDFFDIEERVVSSDILLEIRREEFEDYLVIDLSFNIVISQMIMEFTENEEIINLVAWTNLDTNSDFTFFVHNSIEQEVTAMSALVKHFKWDKIAYVTDGSTISLKAVDMFENLKPTVKHLQIAISQQIVDETISQIVSKIIKQQGYKSFVMFGYSDFYSKFISALKTKKIYKKGVGVIINGFGILGKQEDGLLYVIDDELVTAKTWSEYEALGILFYTDKIVEFITQSNTLDGRTSNLNSMIIKEIFEEMTKSHRKKPFFSIINQANSTRNLIGKINNNQISLSYSNIIFPGNSTDIPDNSIAEIILSIAAGSTEPNGATLNLYNSNNYLGSLYAEWIVNNSSQLLQNFDILQFKTDCGSSQFDETWYYNCMNAVKDNIGVTFLSPSFSAGALGYITTFRALGLSTPQIGAGSRNHRLSSKELYPEFMRVISSSDYFSYVIPKFVYQFGWKNVAVIANEVTENSIYDSFIKECEKLNIKIINDLNKRVIGYNYDRSSFDIYKDVFQGVIDSKARVVVMLISNPDYLHVCEGLYDLGLRRGDIIPIFFTRTGGVQIFANEDTKNVIKRKEIIQGSFSVYGFEYIGHYGLEIEQKIADAFGEQHTSYKCFSFDAFMLAANGIDFSINRGDDYEDPSVLNKNLRKQRFTGCSGTVSIESRSNNRNNMIISLFNFYHNETTNRFEEVPMATFDSLASIPVTLYQDPVWSIPSSKIPSDLRVYDSGCPFEKSRIRDSSKGFTILIGICITLALYTIIMIFLIWKRISKVDHPILDKEKTLKFGDILAYMIVIIDFFQYIYIGPDVMVINPGIGYTSDVLSADFASVVLQKRDVFWKTMTAVLTVGFICLGFGMFTLMRKSHACSRFANLKYFENLILYAMPIVGNILFLPIISYLLDIFSCVEAIGDELSDSFLSKDCLEFCWKGQHLKFAVLSLIVLGIYIPSTLYCRPIYQEMQESLHIKVSPKFILMKTAIQIYFVILKKTLGTTGETAFGIVYIVSIAGHAFLNLNIKPYNYEKLNFWTLISFAMIAWSAILTVLGHLTKTNYIPWIVFQVIGWLSIIIFGLLYNKRIPGFLVARKGVSITHLFRFMFGLGIDIQSIRKKSLKLVSKKRPKFADTTKSEQDTLNVHKIVSSYCEPEIAVAEDKQDLDIDFVEDSRFDDKLSNINRDLDRSYATIRYETEEIPNSDRMMTV